VTALRRTASGATLHVVPSEAPSGGKEREALRLRDELTRARVPGLEPLVRVGTELLGVPAAAVYGVTEDRAELWAAVGPARVVAAFHGSCPLGDGADDLSGPVAFRMAPDRIGFLPLDARRYAPVTVLVVPIFGAQGALVAVSYFLSDHPRPELEDGSVPAVLHHWTRAAASLLVRGALAMEEGADGVGASAGGHPEEGSGARSVGGGAPGETGPASREVSGPIVVPREGEPPGPDDPPGPGPRLPRMQGDPVPSRAFEALLATGSLAVVLTDRDGRVRCFNERAQRHWVGALEVGASLESVLSDVAAARFREALGVAGPRGLEGGGGGPGSPPAAETAAGQASLEAGTGSSGGVPGPTGNAAPPSVTEPAPGEVEERTGEPGSLRIWRTTFEPFGDGPGDPDAGILVIGTEATVLRPPAATDGVLPPAPTGPAPPLDELTGLPNRALAERRLERDLREARREGHGVAVAMIALDRFKRVNDSLGHAHGDALLRQVGERIASCTADADSVARLGGDEFLVILNRIGRSRAALPELHRIHQAVQEPFHVNGNELVVSATAGIACFPEDAAEGPTLRQYADIALHRAKERGRGRIERFEAAMQTSAEDRLRIERELRRALGDRHFILHYQPKYALADGRMTGAEALIRWLHPDRGMVSPGQFIPVAEETGLILPIGTWSLVEACKQRRVWRDLGLAIGGVAVNVSAPQFARRDFVGTVERAIRTSGLDPAQLELEVTESMIMDDVHSAAERLAELRSLGVKVSVDDFGTGYSSLSYLQRLPVDVLKIDRTFVKDLDAAGTEGQQARVLAQAITGLAHSLGLRVVAEGVETVEQLGVLREFGCDEAQGFLFARPIPAEQLGDDVPGSLSPRAPGMGDQRPSGPSSVR